MNATVGVLLAAVALVVVVIVDATAYLTAASRAQAAADAAALAAAAAVDPRAAPRLDPRASATAVALASADGARLERCACGRDRVEVAVSVPVPGLVVPRLAARRVTASSAAELRLVPPGREAGRSGVGQRSGDSASRMRASQGSVARPSGSSGVPP